MDFSRYQAVLLDLDGTIYHEEHPLPGAVELVRHLQRIGQPFACLSNSTTSPSRVVARLAKMGLSVSPDQIYTAAGAAADYVLEKYGPHPRVFNLATEGVQELLTGPAHWVQSGDESCDAILIGTPANTYATEARQRIALVLARRGAELIGTSADRVYPSRRGLEFGAGALTWMLSYAAAVPPTFTGKPQPIFFHTLCHHLKVQPDKCLLIGDNLESDIAGAKAVGMETLLPLTGVTTLQDIARLPAAHRPDRTVKDLTELL